VEINGDMANEITEEQEERVCREGGSTLKDIRDYRLRRGRIRSGPAIGIGNEKKNTAERVIGRVGA